MPVPCCLCMFPITLGAGFVLLLLLFCCFRFCFFISCFRWWSIRLSLLSLVSDFWVHFKCWFRKIYESLADSHWTVLTISSVKIMKFWLIDFLRWALNKISGKCYMYCSSISGLQKSREFFQCWAPRDQLLQLLVKCTNTQCVVFRIHSSSKQSIEAIHGYGALTLSLESACLVIDNGHHRVAVGKVDQCCMYWTSHSHTLDMWQWREWKEGTNKQTNCIIKHLEERFLCAPFVWVFDDKVYDVVATFM